jgi:hypothetical protein
MWQQHNGSNIWVRSVFAAMSSPILSCVLLCYTQHSTHHIVHHTAHTTAHTQNGAHSTQHTAHSTQHTAHSTQHTAHSTQHTAHSTQHTQHTAHCTQQSSNTSTAIIAEPISLQIAQHHRITPSWRLLGAEKKKKERNRWENLPVRSDSVRFTTHNQNYSLTSYF